MTRSHNILLVLIIIAFSCQPRQQSTPAETAEARDAEPGNVVVPGFNADSALAFVKIQCDFGSRVPGTPAHEACAGYLEKTLQRYSPNVAVQAFKARAFDGTVLSGRNIIASFQPEEKARLMLCAHWDSRPFADHDPDPGKRTQPVMGANDGASGVGVLLEIARLLQHHQPRAGVDIVLFDLEDYGPSHDTQDEARNEHWGLGSQYWSRNPHVYNYRPRFAILLDMVGAPDAVFRQEGFSMYYAPDKVNKVWNIAHGLGYGHYFPHEKGGYINDDHYFINELAKIPAIDIIHLDPNSSNGSFFEYWHTTGDTFDKIDKQTLGVVGEVVGEVVWREN